VNTVTATPDLWPHLHELGRRSPHPLHIEGQHSDGNATPTIGTKEDGVHGWEHWHDSGSDWMWWLMLIGIILLWIGVIALVVWLVRTWTSGHTVTGGAAAVPAQTVVAAPPPGGSEATTLVSGPAGMTAAETPLQILARRYAEGEIDRDEYLQRKADLEPGPSPQSPAADTTRQGDPAADTTKQGDPAADTAEHGDPETGETEQGSPAADTAAQGDRQSGPAA